MKISVVGSINMDMTVVAERIPLKGETLKGSDLSYIPGGKGANQAVAMARLGADVTMFGCVGDDANGKMLINHLKSEGVNMDHIDVACGTPTGVAMITVGDQDNTIVIVPGANASVDRKYVDGISSHLFESDIVVLQHEIPLDTVEYVVSICSEKRIRVLLNPAPAMPLKENIVEKVTFLTPNEHEARILFGDIKRDTLLKRYPEKLIITLGREGAAACRSDGVILNVAARPAAVVDTTGAGDTLNAAFAVMIAEGKDLETALKFANVAASLSTEKFGAQGGMPHKDIVIKEMEALQ